MGGAGARIALLTMGTATPAIPFGLPLLVGVTIVSTVTVVTASVISSHIKEVVKDIDTDITEKNNELAIKQEEDIQDRNTVILQNWNFHPEEIYTKILQKVKKKRYGNDPEYDGF